MTDDATPGYAEILGNPGLLKLELIRRGVSIDASARRSIGGHAFGATGHALFGSAGDVDLEIAGGTWVTAPVLPGPAPSSPYRLVANGTGHAVHVDGPGGPRAGVTVHPRPRFFEHSTSTGIPFGRIGTVHGPYLALSPTNRCTFLSGPDRCRFCGVGRTARTHDPIPVDDLLEAIRLARADHAVSMVYLSVGHLDGPDGGVAFIEPYVKAIKKHFDILVALDALPPERDAWIDRTYGVGVDAVSYNLEIFDAAVFERVCPGPARVIGRDRFLSALEYATTVFPSGGVACHLIVCLEPLASTHAGIDRLTSMGVVPVLPVYRPFKGRDMRDEQDIDRFDPGLDELAALYGHLYERVRSSRLSLNLVRDICVVTTPLEARFFAGRPGLWNTLIQRFLGSPFARRTSARLSDMRRALRVREVGGVD